MVNSEDFRMECLSPPLFSSEYPALLPSVTVIESLVLSMVLVEVLLMEPIDTGMEIERKMGIKREHAEGL